MNKIVANNGQAILGDPKAWQKAMQADQRLVQIAPGFEDKAVVALNEPPKHADWSHAKARLAELKEEFAGLEPVTFRVTISVEGEVSWNLNIPKMPRKDARELRRLVQNFVADLSLNLERKITVQGNASTLGIGEP